MILISVKHARTGFFGYLKVTEVTDYRTDVPCSDKTNLTWLNLDFSDLRMNKWR